MDSPEERVKIVIAESECLKQYLNTLPPEAWTKPSACDRWEVRDVVAHLAGQGQFYADMITRSLQGDASTPEGRPAPGTANAASFAEGGAQRAIARREQLGDQLLAEFHETNDQLNHLLASLGPQDWEKPHYFNSLGIAPLRFRPDLRIFELALHGWDIRSRLEPDAHLSAESVPVVLGLVLGPLTNWIFRPGPKLPAPIRYRFALTGAGARNTDIVVAGDTAHIEPVGTAAAHVTCRCDTETFALIMVGRLPLRDALAQHRLVAEGEAGRVNAFVQWFGGA
jgi:uncharacterized protein (TIGR03083 family)